jgi:hypothetical protein
MLNIKPLSTLYPLTKRADDIEVTLLIRNPEVLGLNLGRETNYPDYLWFFLVAPGKYGTVPRPSYGRFQVFIRFVTPWHDRIYK